MVEQKKKHRRRGIAAGLLIALLTASLAGFALWLTSGSGSVASHTGTLTAVVVVGSDNSQALLPGGTANAYATITNNNGTTVKLTSLTQTGDGSGCTLGSGDITFTSAGLPITVGAGATLTHELVGTVTAASSLSNTCQNVELIIPVSTSTTAGT